MKRQKDFGLLVCEQKKQIEAFCSSIIGLEVEKSKALANLVMSLASDNGSNSVTELSKNACYHYQYSSICDSIHNLCRSTKEEIAEQGYESLRHNLESVLLSHKSAYLPNPFDDEFYLLNTDTTPIVRPHSPTLPDRGYVHVPNSRVKGNRPVDVGYEYSVVGLSCRRPLYGAVEPSWNLPLSSRRVPTDVVKGTFTAEQVVDLLTDKHSGLSDNLIVNALDRHYGTPEYIAGTHQVEQLVNIVRLKSNRNVWRQLSNEQKQERRQKNKDNRGANAVYGDQYKLKESEDWELEPDEQTEFGVQLGNGRKVLVRMEGYNDMLIRTKRGQNMKNKPFRLISVELIDPNTNQALFKRKMWLAIWGTKKGKLTLEQIYWAYRNRFDIEHYFRFGKQRLLMDSYQTPDEQHLDNWMEIVGLAYWLLWVARQETNHQVYKWQKYDPYYKNRVKYNLPPTPSEVQRQLLAIILSFEQTPFVPKVKIKSKGRKKGEKQTKRQRYQVVKKRKKKLTKTT